MSGHERGHECEPPMRVTGKGTMYPAHVPTRGTGARWVCDCGTVWVVRPYVLHTVRERWDPESRREARQRLGLRWWRRVPRVSAVRVRPTGDVDDGRTG